MNKHRIAFSITTLIVTGAMLGIYFGIILPNIISSYNQFSLFLKIVLLWILFMYIILAVLSVSGNYLLLTRDKMNVLLRILTVLFCITIGINEMKFGFLPFSLDLNLKFHAFDTNFRVGINFLGIIFIFWFNFLKDVFSTDIDLSTKNLAE